MKFMKLGSKPDAFQADGKSLRYEGFIYVLLCYSSSSQAPSLPLPLSLSFPPSCSVFVFLHFVLFLVRHFKIFCFCLIFGKFSSKELVLLCFFVRNCVPSCTAFETRIWKF
jgi:hypothetical protein